MGKINHLIKSRLKPEKTSFTVSDAYRYSLRVRHSYWGRKYVTHRISNVNEYYSAWFIL